MDLSFSHSDRDAMLKAPLEFFGSVDDSQPFDGFELETLDSHVDNHALDFRLPISG